MPLENARNLSTNIELKINESGAQVEHVPSVKFRKRGNSEGVEHNTPINRIKQLGGTPSSKIQDSRS